MAGTGWRPAFRSAELDVDALRLEGRNGDGLPTRVVRYDDLKEFHLAYRAAIAQGRPTLVLELTNGSELKLASVAQPGIVAELADRASTA